MLIQKLFKTSGKNDQEQDGQRRKLESPFFRRNILRMINDDR